MDARCIVALMLLVLLSHPSECTHIAVGGDGAGFRSIQDAINAAEEEDTIEVQSGIYRENVLIDKP
jgi:pectin methylesterase-like acyl-CoA thioesterase